MSPPRLTDIGWHLLIRESLHEKQSIVAEGLDEATGYLRFTEEIAKPRANGYALVELRDRLGICRGRFSYLKIEDAPVIVRDREPGEDDE